MALHGMFPVQKAWSWDLNQSLDLGPESRRLAFVMDGKQKYLSDIHWNDRITLANSVKVK